MLEVGSASVRTTRFAAKTRRISGSLKSSVLAVLHVGSSLVSEVLRLRVLALVLVVTAAVGGMLNMDLPRVPSLCSRVAWSSVRSVGGAALNSWTPSLS